MRSPFLCVAYHSSSGLPTRDSPQKNLDPSTGPGRVSSENSGTANRASRVSVELVRSLVQQQPRASSRGCFTHFPFSSVSARQMSRFYGKEIVLDALHGSRALRSLIDDINEWCPCGPGARRGLNRIFGRQTSLFVEDNDVESAFISEMASLLSEAQKRMPGWCKDMDIELHDIQFQLCEFDKYERIRQSERGWVARYVPIEKRQPRRNCLSSARMKLHLS